MNQFGTQILKHVSTIKISYLFGNTANIPPNTYLTTYLMFQITPWTSLIPRPELLWTSLQTYLHLQTYLQTRVTGDCITDIHSQTCLQARVTVDFITDILTFTNILIDQSYWGLYYRHTYIYKHTYRPELLWTSIQTYLHSQTYLQTRVTGDCITDILTFTNILPDKSYSMMLLGLCSKDFAQRSTLKHGNGC